MNYGAIKTVDIADGPGVRVTLFVSGCRNHCPGCQNPETWDFAFGERWNWQSEQMVVDALRPYWIQGLTICGGEPFEPENEPELIKLLERVRTEMPGKDIWIYSGHTYEELEGRELLKYADVLVDGPFIMEQKDAGLAFRGSRNQRIIHLRKGEAV